MNLINITEYLLYLVKAECGSGNSETTTDEVFLAKRLFEILKSFKDNYFNEMFTYETLEFDDEYDEMTNEEDSDDDADDYDENEHFDIQNQFTLEEMENIVEWVDQHPNAKIATISNRF
jgi:hypothetical protein